ncbi:hypothetical protein AAVH_37822 [Aphelenchoides avenae]|nr:hypothetical protein AAVH_37822 [Aphelenchus avenae]
MDAGLVRPQSAYSTSAGFMQQNPAACFNECCVTQPHYHQQQQQSAFQPMVSPYGLSPFANVNPFMPPVANSLGYLNTMSRLGAGQLAAYNPMMMPSQQMPFGVPTQFSPAQLHFLDALPPVVNAHVREMFVSVWLELQRGLTHGQIYQNLMIRNPTISSIVAQLFSYTLQLINLGLQSAPMPPMHPMAQHAPVNVPQSTAAQSYESQYS